MSIKGRIIVFVVMLLVAVGMFAAVYFLAAGDKTAVSVALPVSTPLPDGAFFYDEQLLGLQGASDTDGDLVSDRLEFNQYGTNPLLIDTDGGGLDDFNEIFVYGMNPLSASDDAEFLASIPDVEAEYMIYQSCMTNDYLTCLPIVVAFSERDPYIQWIAEKVDAFWYSIERTAGQLMVHEDGEFTLIFNEYVNYNLSTTMTPAYYFSHDRRGKCLDSAIANYTIFSLKGWDCEYIEGDVPDGRHAWLEVTIDGNVYVVDYNRIVWAENWYASHPDWTITARMDFD